MNPTLGIVVALKSEASALLGRRRRLWTISNGILDLPPAGDKDIVIVCSGVGRANALTSAHKLIAEGIRSLASVGLAGGLDPGLCPGHIIIATDLLSIHSGKKDGPWHADTRGVTLAHEILVHENFSIRFGTVLTTSQEILTPRHKALLYSETRALAVDMESAEVARAASEAHIPFFCLRVICDPAQRSVPKELSVSLDPAGDIRLASILRQLVRRPSLVMDLIHLTRCFRSAMPVLEQAWRILMKNNLPQQLTSD